MFLVCGEALFDFFCEPDSAPGNPRLGYQAVAGGSPFNVAVGLRRLGVESALLAGLSSDFLGRRLREVLAREGVSERYLKTFDAPTTLAMVALGPDGSPQYSFRGDGAADRLLQNSDMPDLDESVRGLHVGSFSLMVEPVGSALCALVARESQRRLITLDPNVRLGLAPDITAWRQRIAELATHAHLIKVSDEDLGLLYPGKAHGEIAAAWLQHRCQLVCITLGGAGAVAYIRNHAAVTVAAQPIQVVDTVGAGDTFQAALIAWLTEQQLDSPQGLAELNPRQLMDLLEFATEAAADTCTRTGPDLPYRAKLKR